jgi:3-hydroxyacyl-CoA dehydrogenase
VAVTRTIETVGVVGLGAMGAGIAQLAVEAGFDTIGHEVEAWGGGGARRRRLPQK